MADALDIEETNRVRISLGMQPLPVPNSNGNLNFKKSGRESSGEEDEDLGSTYESRHAAASDNWQKLQDEETQKKRREAKKEALKKEREAAQRYAKLEGKGLGDPDEGDMDTRAWLLSQKKRQKKIDKERKRLMEKELAEREQQAQYTEKDLAGARVGHELSAFDEGEEQVLTLKDTAVDAEDEEDELENVNVREKEKLKERLDLKKRKPVYDPNEVDETGTRKILGQYDEEIEGKTKQHFTLNGSGTGVNKSAPGAEPDGVSIGGQRFSLDFAMPEQAPVSDYMDISEIKVKKPRKKKDKAKRQKAADDDDIFPAAEPTTAATTRSSEAMDVDSSSHSASAKRPREEASFVDDDDLQSNLAMQRRAALKKRKMNRPEELARQLREEASATPDDGPAREDEDGGLIIDETSEFVSNLQKPEAPQQKRATSNKPEANAKQETSPDADADDDAAMPDAEEMEAHVKREASSAAPEPHKATTGLDEEETLGQGMGATLNMLTSRGLLKTANSGDINAQHRERQRFLAEKQQREAEAERKARLQRLNDRSSGKFERMSAREREQYAQWENKQRDQQDSRQISEVFNRDYKPNVDLKYVDEYGRSMNQKEAFKHLSHQFHGKGSGKQKTEKLLKKIDEEKKREAMSSLDSSQATGMNNAMGATQKKNRQAGVRLQ